MNIRNNHNDSARDIVSHDVTVPFVNLGVKVRPAVQEDREDQEDQEGQGGKGGQEGRDQSIPPQYNTVSQYHHLLRSVIRNTEHPECNNVRSRQEDFYVRSKQEDVAEGVMFHVVAAWGGDTCDQTFAGRKSKHISTKEYSRGRKLRCIYSTVAAFTNTFNYEIRKRGAMETAIKERA